MDAKSYCDGLNNGLVGWKAKLYDTIRKMDSLKGHQKETVQQIVDNLNQVIDDLDTRIERLASECPVDFTTDRDEIDGRLDHLEKGWKKVYGIFGEEEYGVGGA